MLRSAISPTQLASSALHYPAYVHTNWLLIAIATAMSWNQDDEPKRLPVIFARRRRNYFPSFFSSGRAFSTKQMCFFFSRQYGVIFFLLLAKLIIGTALIARKERRRGQPPAKKNIICPRLSIARRIRTWQLLFLIAGSRAVPSFGLMHTGAI